MTTIDHLKSVMPGQPAAWYTRIAAEIDAGRMPMPGLEHPKPSAVAPKPSAVAPKPSAVGKDYTVLVLRAIGFGLLTSYFVVFVSNSALVGLSVAAYITLKLKSEAHEFADGNSPV